MKKLNINKSITQLKVGYRPKYQIPSRGISKGQESLKDIFNKKSKQLLSFHYVPVTPVRITYIKTSNDNTC